MKRSTTDVLVVGGGAAGLFSARTAAAAGASVTLLEKNAQLGRKLRITGKGRCNVTNDCPPEQVLQNTLRGAKFLRGALYRWTPRQMMDYLSTRGCPLKTERGGRVFPVSDCAADIVRVLENDCRENGVNFLQGEAKELLVADGRIAGVRLGQGRLVAAHRVIVCTGGCSYPTTGSDGAMYAQLRALGHTVTPPRGALVPLVEDGETCRSMMGLSLRNVGVRLLDAAGRTVYTDFGELLFTHFGLSGPTALSASCHVEPGCRYEIEIDLKPALDEKTLDARLLRDLAERKNQAALHALGGLLPRTMLPVVLRRAGIALEQQANTVTKQARRALLQTLKHFRLAISGTRPVAEAIITCGGVALPEVNARTMESKLVQGLYFAGEVLDADAYTGGFNLQIAWSTAFAAGTAAATQGKGEKA